MICIYYRLIGYSIPNFISDPEAMNRRHPLDISTA